jgi:hypothetical protein
MADIKDDSAAMEPTDKSISAALMTNVIATPMIEISP